MPASWSTTPEPFCSRPDSTGHLIIDRLLLKQSIQELSEHRTVACRIVI